MPLKEQLSTDLKDAMRAREDLRRDVLRMALSALHNAEIEKGEELDEAGVMRVLSSEANRRRESIEEFTKAGRQDLVDKEQAELAFLSAYLPEQLSNEKIVAIARRVIEETGASGPSDIGKVMPGLMRDLQGRADGRIANQIVRELLSGA